VAAMNALAGGAYRLELALDLPPGTVLHLLG
jgi:hypothetical protein